METKALLEPQDPSQQLLEGLFILMNCDSTNTGSISTHTQNLTLGLYQLIYLNAYNTQFQFLWPKMPTDDFLLKCSEDDLVIQGQCDHQRLTLPSCDAALLQVLSIQLEDGEREHRKHLCTTYHFTSEMTHFFLTPLTITHLSCQTQM